MLDGYVDTENIASQQILKKCGFTKCETLLGDFESPSMGLRDSIVFRLARPGKTLKELGLGAVGEDARSTVVDEPPEPPVQ